MNLKLGLIHLPKPAGRVAVPHSDFYARRRHPVSSESPLELLARIREANRRVRHKWKRV
jgi:hypothetical protein